MDIDEIMEVLTRSKYCEDRADAFAEFLQLEQPTEAKYKAIDRLPELKKLVTPEVYEKLKVLFDNLTIMYGIDLHREIKPLLSDVAYDKLLEIAPMLNPKRPRVEKLKPLEFIRSLPEGEIVRLWNARQRRMDEDERNRKRSAKEKHKFKGGEKVVYMHDCGRTLYRGIMQPPKENDPRFIIAHCDENWTPNSGYACGFYQDVIIVG